jgi:hypothetical protein
MMVRRMVLRTFPMYLSVMLLGLVALAGCGGAPSRVKVNTPTPPTPTATVPATTAGHLTLVARQAVGQAAKTVDVTYSGSDRSAVVDVTLVWLPTWRDHFSQAQTAAKQACYQAQAALWASGVPLDKVTVIVLGQALDDYASVITSAYAEADLTASHARAIAWASLTPDQAWARYDNEFLRPTYAPNWVYLSGR